MGRKKRNSLKIDAEFKKLVLPLHPNDYLELEKTILSDGCFFPVFTWNGTIIDGFDRYEICIKNRISVRSEEIKFDCREEAIAWICARQLRRNNLPEEMRKFLIGLEFEARKSVRTQKLLRERSSQQSDVKTGNRTDFRLSVSYIQDDIAGKIAKDNHIAIGTVRKYAAYAGALKIIDRKGPKLVSKILAGQYKISHENVLELAKLNERELASIFRRLERAAEPTAQNKTIRKAIEKPRIPQNKVSGSQLVVEELLTGPSVKDMPEYDPDAEVVGLSLTIPSWLSSVTRVRSETDFTKISNSASCRLQLALLNLQKAVADILVVLKEGHNCE